MSFYKKIVVEFHGTQIKDVKEIEEHVVRTLVGAFGGGLLDALRADHVVGQRLTVKVFLPLVGQSSRNCVKSCLNKSHVFLLRMP